MTNNDVIIVRTRPIFTVDKRGKYEIETISVAAFNKMPFSIKNFDNSVKVNGKYIDVPEMGSLVRVQNDETWRTIRGYNNHEFEIATVLGVRQNKSSQSELLVYGQKIGEHVIPGYDLVSLNQSAGFDVHRGDLLLLTKNNSIVHNITQCMMKYNHDKMFNR